MNVGLVRFIRTSGLVAVASAAVLAQTPAPLYPGGDARAQIEAALAAAKKDGRHVLLDFGADWCPDCRVLGSLLDDPTVAAVVEKNFHVVRIDVGRRDKNSEVAAKYGATSGDWIPAIVVLAPDGATVAVTNESVRLTRRTTQEELLKLLRAWAPKTATHHLAEFVERGVRVEISLDRDRSGGVWLAGRFAPTSPDTHVYGVDLPAEGIQGLGRPTRLAIAETSSLRAIGPLVADRPVKADRLDGLGVTLPIYPPGEVTLRVPVTIIQANGRAEVMVSYMACGPRGCLAPVTGRRVPIVLPAK